MPGIAYWKGKIKPGESAETILSMDILPTLLKMSGAEFPEELKFDGWTCRTTFLGDKPFKKGYYFGDTETN